jgi:hypothetical protein
MQYALIFHDLQLILALMRVHPQLLKDAVHAEGSVILQEQIALLVEQDDIQVAREAWPWHASRGIDGQERAVIIANV